MVPFAGVDIHTASPWEGDARTTKCLFTKIRERPPNFKVFHKSQIIFFMFLFFSSSRVVLGAFLELLAQAH